MLAIKHIVAAIAVANLRRIDQTRVKSRNNLSYPVDVQFPLIGAARDLQHLAVDHHFLVGAGVVQSHMFFLLIFCRYWIPLSVSFWIPLWQAVRCFLLASRQVSQRKIIVSSASSSSEQMSSSSISPLDCNILSEMSRIACKVAAELRLGFGFSSDFSVS